MSKDIDAKKILRETFEKLGAKPTTLIIPDIVISKSESLESIYKIPGNPNVYISEGEARKDMRGGDTLYELKITRLE